MYAVGLVLGTSSIEVNATLSVNVCREHHGNTWIECCGNGNTCRIPWLKHYKVSVKAFSSVLFSQGVIRDSSLALPNPYGSLPVSLIGVNPASAPSLVLDQWLLKTNSLLPYWQQKKLSQPIFSISCPPNCISAPYGLSGSQPNFLLPTWIGGGWKEHCGMLKDWETSCAMCNCPLVTCGATEKFTWLKQAVLPFLWQIPQFCGATDTLNIQHYKDIYSTTNVSHVHGLCCWFYRPIISWSYQILLWYTRSVVCKLFMQIFECAHTS